MKKGAISILVLFCFLLSLAARARKEASPKTSL